MSGALSRSACDACPQALHPKVRNARAKPHAPERPGAAGPRPCRCPAPRPSPDATPAPRHCTPGCGTLGQNPMHLNAPAPPAQVRADVRCAGQVRMRCLPPGTAPRDAERSGKTPCTTASVSHSGRKHHIGAQMRQGPPYPRQYSGGATLAARSHPAPPCARSLRATKTPCTCADPTHLYRCAPLPSLRAARPEPHAPDHRRASCAQRRTASRHITTGART